MTFLVFLCVVIPIVSTMTKPAHQSTYCGKQWRTVAPGTGLRPATDKEMEEFSREMEEYSREMEEFGKEMAKVYVAASPDARVYHLDREDYAESIARAEKARAKAHEKAAEARERAALDREKAAIERAKANEIRAKEREKAAKERAKAAEERAKAAKERNERMEKLKAELVKDKLVGEKDKSLSYKISKEGLYVNGKKQPQATFEKYKKMFHPNMKEGSNYNEVYNITAD